MDLEIQGIVSVSHLKNMDIADEERSANINMLLDLKIKLHQPHNLKRFQLEFANSSCSTTNALMETDVFSNIKP